MKINNKLGLIISMLFVLNQSVIASENPKQKEVIIKCSIHTKGVTEKNQFIGIYV